VKPAAKNFGFSVGPVLQRLEIPARACRTDTPSEYKKGQRFKLRGTWLRGPQASDLQEVCYQANL